MAAVTALVVGTIAIAAGVKTKKEKYLSAGKKEKKYKLSYSKCKKARLDKGKTVFGFNDTRKGALVKNCHVSHTKWKKWEREHKEARDIYEALLEKKGKKGKGAKDIFSDDRGEDIETLSDAAKKAAKKAEKKAAKKAEKKAAKKAEKKAAKSGKKGKKGKKGQTETDEFLMTDDGYADDVEEGMSTNNMALLAVAGLAAVGGIYWFFIRTPNAE
jgi:hypothetical protein